MAFNSTNGDDDQVLADINVTPLVDVMLVLLIIFMIAAPMLHQGIEVALPRSQAKALPVKVEDPLVVSINKDGLVYIQETPVAAADLVERLRSTIARRHDDSVFLKGDREVAYGKIIDVLDVLQRGGIQHVGMVTERPPRSRSR
ncbi:MAG TPA: protein TolR [Thermoanaerobaculia bacterium]|jgi:biopolymer transport protein TolR